MYTKAVFTGYVSIILLNHNLPPFVRYCPYKKGGDKKGKDSKKVADCDS